MIRWTAILVFVSCLHVSARTYSQHVTLKAKNQPLLTVLRSIERQADVNLVIQTQLLQHTRPVNIDIRDMPLEAALQKCFEGQPITYVLTDRTIVLKQKEFPSGTEAVIPSAAEGSLAHDIRVHITDSTGSPLQGASVVVKGTKQGGQTDADGNITLAGLNGGETLVVSYVGYETKEIRVGDDTALSIALKHSASQLDDMVLKGYYNTTRALNTGDVSTVKALDIARQPVNDPLLALEGRVPGLSITQVSGVPGSSIKVSLRGRNSIANGTDPLYIVDGIPFDSKPFMQFLSNAAGGIQSPFMSIRPEDIESIDVLKDADATAIYGSRGANGVILITTKKGKVGRTNVDINIYSGIGEVPKKLNLMNTQEYLEMRREAYKNDGVTPPTTAYDVNGTWDTTWSRDWQKIMIGGTAKTTNANLSISGGNENTQFLFGTSYRRETTVFPGDYANKIGSGNLNVHHTSENKKFTADLSINYSNNNNRLPLEDFTSKIFAAPNSPPLYNPDGSLNFENSTWTNPLASTLRKSTAITNNLLTNATLSYNILKDLQLKSNFGYNLNNTKQVILYPFSAINPAFADPAHYRTQSRLNMEGNSWIIEPQLNYSKDFGFHHLDILAGTTFQSKSQESLQETATGFSSDDLIENFGAGTTISNVYANYSDYRYTAFYARLGYNFKQKYILNLTGRRDGSSRFGPGKQFGNFGALGVAWVFSKERFIKNKLRFISYGKIRASVGKTGNDQLQDYAYLSTYMPQYGTYLGVNGLYPYNLYNPSYGWENINKIEGGIELGLLKDRILLNVNFYRNRTSNQLVGYSLAGITGFSSVIANLPAVIQNKGLEADISTTNISKTNFTWKTNANISFPHSKLISFPNIDGTSYANSYAVGQPLSIVYAYVYTGIDPNTGIYTFADLNDDKKITSSFDRVPVFYGTKFYGGITNSISYGAFELEFMVQFVKQIGYRSDIIGPPGTTNYNQLEDLLDRWKNPDETGHYQKYSTQFTTVYNANNQYLASDAMATDISFLRLKNLSISWNLPESLIRKMKINRFRIYAQAQNLLTISNFKGLDPENQVSSIRLYNLPPLRILTIGAQLTL